MPRPPSDRRPYTVRLRPQTVEEFRRAGEATSEVLRRIVAAGVDALRAAAR